MKLTFEEWKKQYCAEPTPQILDDLKRLHNIKDPKAHILHMQKNAYIEYAHNEWLKDNPSLVIQAEPMKQASDKSTLLGELLDHNIPNIEETQKYLKSLCQDYDKEYGRYPESSYEGRALYEHFCEKNNLPCDTDQWWAEMKSDKRDT